MTIIFNLYIKDLVNFKDTGYNNMSYSLNKL